MNIYKNTFILIAVILVSIGNGMAATCTNPAKRKEWRSLTKAEKANWVSAIKCLSKQPVNPRFTRDSDGGSNGIPKYNASASLYDDFVYSHVDLARKIHGTGFFLPWHRWYIQALENAMKERCNLTTHSPYWDWTKDGNATRTSEIFTDLDPESGLGGWGAPENDYELTSGAFSDGFIISYPSPHRLRRKYTSTLKDTGLRLSDLFSKAAVDTLLAQPAGNFTAFHIAFESPANGSHVAGHYVVGGDLAAECPAGAPADCILSQGFPLWTPNEPMFFLHHAMVDKTWRDWQQRSPASAKAFAGGSILNYAENPTGLPPMLSVDSAIPTSGLGLAASISDVMDTTSGFLCYEYE